MPKSNQTTLKTKPSKPGFQWNFQNLIFIGVLVIFSVSVIWSDSISRLFSGFDLQDKNLIPTPTTLFGTPTPLPAEYFTSSDQTNGILLGVIVLGVIIIIGTIGILIRDRS
jgi:hypothetical protein